MAPPDWVFLDRDGTINRPVAPQEYVTRPADLQLLPGAAAAIARLNRAAIWVGIATNQQGIGLGRFSCADLLRVHERLRELLACEGAHVDGIWVCPHVAGVCDCRKPLPGLLLRAAREVPKLDLERAVMIGDAESDMAAGHAAGVRTVRLGPVRGGASLRASDLRSAVELLLEQ